MKDVERYQDTMLDKLVVNHHESVSKSLLTESLKQVLMCDLFCSNILQIEKKQTATPGRGCLRTDLVDTNALCGHFQKPAL